MLDEIFVIENFLDHFSSKDRKIEIPRSVIHISKGVFKDLHKINKVTIHNSVKKIGESAFEGCDKLASIKFLGDSELVVIPKKCFKDCTSLTSFIIPPEVGVIKKYAFSGCTNIKHIIIPKDVIAVEVGAFDKWTENQTIEMYSNFKFGVVCKAKIINHSLTDVIVEEDEIYEFNEGKYMYSVLTKCGHVGRNRYMPINFAVVAPSKKEAARIAREIPRVKHHHKDAILEVKQISLNEFNRLNELNNEDPYLKIKSKYQQKPIKDLIDDRAVLEVR